MAVPGHDADDSLRNVMDDLLAARWQMAFSLGFHMFFACVGMAMPVMMLVAEGRWLWKKDPVALKLARTWAKVTAVLFAIGAVSGTVLSFELGLLWPRLMEFGGPLIGGAFAIEGYFFFIEAIFLGLYLYGWNRLSPFAHWMTGWPIAIAGTMSGVVVISANAWMQQPVGFELGPDGMPQNVDALAALLNPAFPLLAAHSTLSTYQSVGFAAAGVYALALLRNTRPERREYNRRGLLIAMALAVPSAIAQPLLGDLLAERSHRFQPEKLAAAEAQFRTERRAPLRIGGWPDMETLETRWAIEIPGALSLLATRSLDGEVLGLDAFPRDEWPDPRIVHPAFQIMVGFGFLMVGVSLWFTGSWVHARRQRRPWWPSRRLSWALISMTPLGFVSLQAGWIVTEVGRQPWAVYRVLRTADVVTPVHGVVASFIGAIVLYTALAAVVILLLRRIAASETLDENGY
jgi:cytochrome bd ubiquinol oxidase subunit I